MTTERWQQKLGDFEKALTRLQDALQNDEPNQLERDGTVQRFEFTFELAWKTTAGFFKKEGYSDVVSPRDALKQAFKDGIITDGDLWMKMLDDRNRTTHLYDEETTDAIYERIRDKYLGALQELLQALKRESDE